MQGKVNDENRKIYYLTILVVMVLCCKSVFVFCFFLGGEVTFFDPLRCVGLKGKHAYAGCFKTLIQCSSPCMPLHL